MATIDIPAFAAAAESLALKVDSASLRGLLRRSLVVPKGFFAWVRDDDGREEIKRSGAEQGGTFSAVLVRDGEIAVSFQIGALPTREGMPAVVAFEAGFAVPPRAIEVRELVAALLRDRARADTADLRAYLTPSVRSALALFAAGRTAEDLASKDLRADLEAHVKSDLKPACFSAGLDLREVRHATFYVEEWEKRRKLELEARASEEDLKRSERLQELRSSLEKNEVLKKREVEELAKVLQYEGVLKELSLKTELDRKRKENDLKRFEELHERLGKDDVKALIFLLEDERLKASLIEQLVLRDMSEEQIRAKQASDVERKMEARIEELQAKLNELAGTRASRMKAGGTRTRRLLGAYGKTVVAFDPTTNVRREAPKETYAFEGRELGYVRSVRAVVVREGPTLLVGAQRGVYAVLESEPANVRELRFPREPSGQGGVNAAAYFDGHFYATHSELGLFRWDQSLISRGEALFEEVTSRSDSTRGAHMSGDGKLFFASGGEVYRADLVRPNQDLVQFRGADEPITSFLVTRDEVIAGTRGGRILRWSLGDPHSPRELNVRKAEPIYMLKVAELSGDDHLLVGAKEHGITAVSLGDGRTVDFRAPDQIRWVDGASDFVFGVSRSGYTIHVFEGGRLDGEVFQLRVADRLQDIAIEKERVSGVS